MRTLVVLAVAICVDAGNVPAQVFGPSSGDRIRVTAPSLSRHTIVGTLRHRMNDTVVVVQDRGVPAFIPVAAIEKVELSLGRRACSGVLPGLLVGAILGIVVVVTDDTGGVGMLVAPLAALTGYAVVAFAVRQFSCERWTPVIVPTST